MAIPLGGVWVTPWHKVVFYWIGIQVISARTDWWIAWTPWKVYGSNHRIKPSQQG